MRVCVCAPRPVLPAQLHGPSPRASPDWPAFAHLWTTGRSLALSLSPHQEKVSFQMNPFLIYLGFSLLRSTAKCFSLSLQMNVEVVFLPRCSSRQFSIIHVIPNNLYTLKSIICICILKIQILP